MIEVNQTGPNAEYAKSLDNHRTDDDDEDDDHNHHDDDAVNNWQLRQYLNGHLMWKRLMSHEKWGQCSLSDKGFCKNCIKIY